MDRNNTPLPLPSAPPLPSGPPPTYYEAIGTTGNQQTASSIPVSASIPVSNTQPVPSTAPVSSTPVQSYQDRGSISPYPPSYNYIYQTAPRDNEQADETAYLLMREAEYIMQQRQREQRIMKQRKQCRSLACCMIFMLIMAILVFYWAAE